MNYLQFIESAKRVSPQTFYASRIAADNGIDETWWPGPAPRDFLVFAGHAWIAEFEGGKYVTVIESQTLTGELYQLTEKLFDWFDQ